MEKKIETRGRKAMSSDGSVMIYARVPVQLKKRLAVLAKQNNRTPSAYMRDILIAWVNGETKK